MKLEFWFDFASTYSYISAMRIESLAVEHDIAISWKAFLLGPIFNRQGWDDSPFNIYPVKGNYMWRDMERICNRFSLPFNRPSQFPRNGLLAARVVCQFSTEEWVPDFVKMVYHANFVLDQDISSPKVLSDCLQRLNVDPVSILAEASSTLSKERLRHQTDEAYRLGVFGAPSFMVGDELFWGDDRLDAAISWVSSSERRKTFNQ